jgi:nitroimidazol reductase NimA-like FMN-containing flavoprotein (pyridoxamine 5'-phosphate oxidase superfamily)
VSADREPLLSGAPAAFLDACRVVYLATVQPDGSPHLVPISPVVDLDRIVFATESDTAKVRNLRADARVRLGADAYDEDWKKLRSVIAVGEAQIIEAGFEWERARTLLYEKYPQYPTEAPITEGSTVIVDVRVDRVITWGF